MPKSQISAWRGLSGLVQADILTPQTVDTRIRYVGNPLRPAVNEEYVNDDEVNGEPTADQSDILNFQLGGPVAAKATPTLVGLLASMCMGADEETQIAATAGYTHELTTDIDTIELPTRSMVEFDGHQQVIYPGVACTQFQLSGGRGGHVEFSANILGRGSETTDATVKPALPAESLLTYHQVNVWKGGSYNGTSVSGAAKISAQTKTWQVTYDNQGGGVYHVGDTTRLVASLRRGPKVQINASLGLEVEDSLDHRAELLSGAEFLLHFPIVGAEIEPGAHYGLELILPRCKWASANDNVENGILGIDGQIRVLADPTYDPMILIVRNTRSTNYLATS